MALALPRHRLFALVSALVATAVFGVGFGVRMMRRRAHDPALAAVPRESYLAATFDLDELRRSALAGPLAQIATGMFSGVTEITAQCGFDPAARAHRLALTVPEAGSNGEFGIVITGEIHRDELVACAKKVIELRGGAMEVKSQGGFTVLTDPTLSLPGEKAGKDGPPHLALREGGPLLVGRGAWLDTMMETAEGRHPNVETNPAHAALAAKMVEPDVARALLATAVLPKELRERLKREMAAELDPADPASGNATMAAVLGVESAGLALTSGVSGKETAARLELKCDTSSSCIEVAHLLEKNKAALAKNFGARLLGLGPVIDSFTIAVHDDAISASAHGSSDVLARAADRALGKRSTPLGSAQPRTPPPPAASK